MNEVIVIKDMYLAILFQDELKSINKRTPNMAYNQFTKEELSFIKKVKIVTNGVKDISELIYCTNLKYLEISSTIAKQADIPLTRSYNYDPIRDYNYFQIAITDFSIISKLASLEVLSISNTKKIRGLDLTNLSKLGFLDLSNNENLTVIRGLESLNLSELKLYRNNLSEPINLSMLLEKGLTKAELDFDMYNKLKILNKDIYEVIKKYRSENYCQFFFLENLSGLRTNNITENRMEAMDLKANEIISEIIDDDYDEIKKVVAVYYYLISNVKYDYETLEAKNTGKNIYAKPGEVTVLGERLETIYGRINSSYNAIIDNKAVCEGYTNMMHYLLNMIDVESRTVSCSTLTDKTEYVGANSNHSIIRVKINDGWYYFDPTNDCMVNDVRYFFKTKKEIEQKYVLSMDDYNVENVENKVYSNNELTAIFNIIAARSKEDIDSSKRNNYRR